MWAVLICTHATGGESIGRIACPSARVASTRERRISSRLSGVLTQSTERPTRLTSPAAPSSTSFQSPSVRASQVTCRHGPLTGGGGLRDSRMIGVPALARWVASDMPRKPLPPAITTGPALR